VDCDNGVECLLLGDYLLYFDVVCWVICGGGVCAFCSNEFL